MLTNFDKYKCTEKPSVKDYKGLHSCFIRVRIITNHDIILKSKKIKREKIRFFPELMKKVLAKRVLPSYNIIFHLHGGGFCSATSYTHCCYLIEWANQSNSVVFSIDYNLAPKQKLDQITNEVIASYVRIINNCAELFSKHYYLLYIFI